MLTNFIEFEGEVRAQPSTYVPETETSQNPPNRLLFIENLSEKASNKEQLEHLFKQYQGLLDIRLIESNTSIAFIEYETVNQAAVVREGLQGFKFLGNNLKISFAK
jgi:RNA recognition motif-containing protein